MHKVDGIQRFIPAAETVISAASVAESLGVTRIADITGLDRVGIPVYSAIVPDSADNLSVYNGKGLRPVDAKAGALMEAIEQASGPGHQVELTVSRARHARKVSLTW